MIELALPYKCKHRDAGIQKVFPNGVFDLPNGRKWAPRWESRKYRGALQSRPLLNFLKPRVIPDAFPAWVELEPAEPFITFVCCDI